MSKEQFIKIVMENLQRLFGEDYRLESRQTIKNNDVRMESLYIRDSKESMLPIIHLEEYYKEHQSGKGVGEIVLEIFLTFRRAMQERGEVDIMELLSEYDPSNLFAVLVNRERNRERLKETPHDEFLDLAIVCRLFLGSDGKGIASLMVNNKIMEGWGFDKEKLIKDALGNTEIIHPTKIVTLAEKVDELFGGKIPVIERNEERFIIISNQLGINGAIGIVTTDALEELSEKFNDDLIVIPSSIHEVIAIPREGKSMSEMHSLSKLVRETNQSTVVNEEVLSDNLYLYNRKEGVLEIVGEKE